MKKNGRNGIEYHSERNKVELDFYGLSPCCPLLHKVKREASRVVGNIAHLFLDDLETAIHSLMENTKNDGTVIRWGQLRLPCQECRKISLVYSSIRR